MKKFNLSLVLVSVFALVSGCATPGANTPAIVIQDTHQVEGKEKAEIFTSTRLWLAETFTDSKKVIELSDEENGTLVGNGMFDLQFVGMELPTKFSLRIDVKDERIRTTYRNFQMYGSYSNDWIELREGSPNGYPSQIRQKVRSLNESLITSIKTNDADDEW